MPFVLQRGFFSSCLCSKQTERRKKRAGALTTHPFSIHASLQTPPATTLDSLCPRLCRFRTSCSRLPWRWTQTLSTRACRYVCFFGPRYFASSVRSPSPLLSCETFVDAAAVQKLRPFCSSSPAAAPPLFHRITDVSFQSDRSVGTRLEFKREGLWKALRPSGSEMREVSSCSARARFLFSTFASGEGNLLFLRLRLPEAAASTSFSFPSSGVNRVAP